MVTFDVRVITGESDANLNGIDRGMRNAAGSANGLTSAISKIGTAAFAFNNIKSAVSGIADDFKAAVQPGIEFNDQMKDLQSITGISDAQLKLISASARENAKAFGVDASSAVESYKFILSQLGPEIANNDKALAVMGTNASVLSKQLGGDVAGATQILTTAMNQYGVSLADPMQASKVMAEYMNIMSAAAKEGSAELPQIKGALEQSGMMAKTAGVQFGELNAAIQVLDKAGKKGAEGGVAIRNMLAELSQGAMNSPKKIAMLEQSGINVDSLADKSLTFAQRLRMLTPIAADTAKMTQLFGKENVSAGIALVQSVAEVERLTDKIGGTNTAVEMANTKMTSYKEVMSRATAQIKDWGISIFDAMEPMMPFFSVAGGGIKILSDLGAAIGGVSILAESRFGAAIGRAASATLGFVKNLALGTLSLLRQGVVMGVQAVLSIGTYAGSLIVATAAQLGLNAAMYANPIGIVVLGIGAAIGAVALLINYWDEIWGAIKGFTAWIYEHSPFKWLIDTVEKIFPGFKAAMGEVLDWVKKKFEAVIDWFKNAWKKIKGFFSFSDGDGKEATKEQAAAMEAAVTDAVSTPVEVKAVVQTDTERSHYSDKKTKAKSAEASRKAAENISSGGTRPTTIHLHINKLQDQITIHTTNLQMGAKEAGRQIVEEILMALNSVNGKATATG